VADLADIPTNVLVAGTTVLGAIGGAVGWLFKSKQAELDAANARILVLQDKLVCFLRAQVESEPARKEALAAMARATADTNQLIRERLKP